MFDVVVVGGDVFAVWVGGVRRRAAISAGCNVRLQCHAVFASASA